MKQALIVITLSVVHHLARKGLLLKRGGSIKDTTTLAARGSTKNDMGGAGRIDAGGG